MKILVLTFYYRPDLAAGSFRATALVEALRTKPGVEVDVLTTSPNRYHTYAAAAEPLVRTDNLTIRRIALPPHQSGMLDQSRAFAAFTAGVLRAVKGERYDLVFATSSRLMTAVLGAVVAKRTGAKLYLDLRDIFADTMKEVLPRKVSWFFGPVLSAAETWVVRRADAINLVSRGFAGYFEKRHPGKRYTYFTNGIDDEFVRAAEKGDGSPTRSRRDGPLRVMYAGNCGDGQGLHAILPELAARTAGRLAFTVIGDGGKRPQLEAGIAARALQNVELRPPVGRDLLVRAYREADVLFLHLNDYEAFRKVLPSKLFEYAATGKPIWAGVSGYAAEFVRSEISNAAVFSPCSVEEALSGFERLVIEDRPRPEFVSKYLRANLSAAMADDILEVARA